MHYSRHDLTLWIACLILAVLLLVLMIRHSSLDVPQRAAVGPMAPMAGGLAA